MKYTAFVVLTIFMASSARAEPPASLFFTPEESKAIDALVAKEGRPDDPSLLRLDALFYYGPDSWVFWLNGKQWTPGADQQRLHVISVDADEIHLQWIDDANTPREVMLKPHQVFQTTTGAVIER